MRAVATSSLYCLFNQLQWGLECKLLHSRYTAFLCSTTVLSISHDTPCRRLVCVSKILVVYNVDATVTEIHFAKQFIIIDIDDHRRGIWPFGKNEMPYG